MRKPLIVAGAMAMAAILAPVQITPAALVAGDGDLIRLNTACGQATSCRPQTNYLCSTLRADWPHYTCNTGCEPPPNET
jgi:hypothetical protein